MDREGGEHLPVLVEEVSFLLRPRYGGWVVDATVGTGGHAMALLEQNDAARLLGIDRDAGALARARTRLARFGVRVVLRHGNFRDLGALARSAGVTEAETVLLDLGVSTYQLEASGRGFSFRTDEPLDMRMDPSEGSTAAQLLQRLSEAELTRIFHEYGDEPHARRIARAVVTGRRRASVSTTADLVAAVKAAVPRRAWPRRTHVATRVFQALRIAVNDELGALAAALPQAAQLLAPGGRLGVISFHSGEDRLVKLGFTALASGPYVVLTPGPLRPSRDEVRANPRARSAKLRILERVEAIDVAA
ncbi:MAG: 16S rRNA (cytosine(1402)-N(4))-methyltransferase RsmH [Candidatus Rokubacteria bacterium]|nr:16S rRNA (cytosine(1402)-N(4))-methyltransferase RsmH [Candidatus Rokubacteria bacterium]